jgi:hypothetical protein
MGHFDGIEKAKIFGTGVYLQPDQLYKLKVLKTEVIKTREKGDAFIADFEVIESTSPQDPVGSTRNMYISLLKNKDTAFSNIVQFLVAALGVDYSTPDGKKFAEEDIIPGAKALLDEACEKNTLASKVVRCQSQSKTSKENRAYTRLNFSPG